MLLLAIWISSAWWRFHLEAPPTTEVALVWGRLHVMWDRPLEIPTSTRWWSAKLDDHRLEWGFEIGTGVYTFSSTGKTSYVVVIVPMWSLVCLFAGPGIWLWYRDGRRALGLCRKCGYDLRGNTSGVCSECGSPPPQPSPAEPGAVVERRFGSAGHARGPWMAESR